MSNQRGRIKGEAAAGCIDCRPSSEPSTALPNGPGVWCRGSPSARSSSASRSSRYVFSIGSICLQELYVWQHALVFLLGAGYTLMHGGHVRVDIFYARMTPRRRAWIDLFGTVFFLAPWLFVLVWFGWPFLARSWSLFEASGQAGGCQGYFIMKSAIVLFAALVAIQGVALFCRSVLVLGGRLDYAPQAGGVRDVGREAP